MKTIKLHNLFGNVIMTRNSVINLFNSLVDNTVLDFKEIEFISRTAAHEYLRQKSSLNLDIKEISMSKNVRTMFVFVANQMKKIDMNINA